MNASLSRRSLLKYGGSLWATAALVSQLPLIASAASKNRAAQLFTTLSADEAATVEAISARILPTTDTPGAREAGAVWFTDAVLAGDMKEALPLIRQGCLELNAAGKTPFYELLGDDQDALLRDREEGEFFGLMHFLTLAGTFTMSEYSGNRENVGWRLLGLTEQHHWTPPFGYYDRAANGAQDA